jgi:outer membrane protein assembly factor BamB
MLSRLPLLICAGLVFGQWPQWRGPARDGTVPPSALPTAWPAILKLEWERNVGEGYSGPVAADDRVWVHARQGEDEVVSCLRLSSGQPFWSRRYASPFRQDNSALAHGRGPYSTPAVAGGRLFTFSVTSTLSAWDAGTGRLLWSKESSKEFQPGYPYFGEAASPLVWGDLCFVHLGGHPRDDFQKPGLGAIVALSVADGREIWRWNKEDPAIGASPILQEIAGRPHLIFKTKQNIVGLDPRTGWQLWQIPAKAGIDNTIVTPLFVDGLLLNSDYDSGISAWRIQPFGEHWATRRLWQHRQVSLFMNSLVPAGGLVVGFSHFQKGQLFGLDPATGAIAWRGAPRSGEHASLIASGGRLLVFLDDGSLTVGQVLRDRFQPERKYNLGASVAWAHPAVAGNRLIVRDGGRLAAYCLD